MVTGFHDQDYIHNGKKLMNPLDQLSAIEYGSNGLKFGRYHNKIENSWSKLHPLQEGEEL